MTDETSDAPSDASEFDYSALFGNIESARRDGYVAGLMERTRRLRDAEDDIASLRLAVLLLCAAVAALTFVVMREPSHAV